MKMLFILLAAATTMTRIIAAAWPSSHPPRPLHEAARTGDVSQIATRLSDNPDHINVKDQSGLTPLHWAVLGGHKAGADFLISKGADVNSTNAMGMSLLHQAVIFGRGDMAELLMHGGERVVRGVRAPVHQQRDLRLRGGAVARRGVERGRSGRGAAAGDLPARPPRTHGGARRRRGLRVRAGFFG